MIHRNSECKKDIPAKEIEVSVQIPYERLEELEEVIDLKSGHVFFTFMFAMTGFLIFSDGLYNLTDVYRHQYGYEGDSLPWTTSTSVLIFGTMAILVAYCSYCAISIKDLGISSMVLTMQSSMMILELVTAGYLNQNRLTWHSILGRITNYYNISLFVGGVFIIHVFSWIYSYRLCGHLILEKEQQSDRDATELEGAKTNKFLNFCVLIICFLAYVLIEIDDIIINNKMNMEIYKI